MTERIQLTVQKGALVPADSLSESRLRERGYRIGDTVFAEIRKPRNPRFHRLAHALGAMIAENVEGFESLGAHKTLKRLQIECGAGCEEIGIKTGETLQVVRVPLSLSFESMQESEFHGVISAICNHVSRRYWPDVSVEEILQLAQEYER